MIAFDELDVKKRYEIELKKKVVLGPAKKLQMVLARGLTDHWKQPVFFDFNRNMTKTLLEEIVIEVEKTGMIVVGFTFDLGNQTLKSELGFTDLNYVMPHPTDPSRKLYLFPDAPHMLKLCRNWLLDNGFQIKTESGDYVPLQKSQFDLLLNLDCREKRITYKLQDVHLNLKGQTRQRVSYAAQLLSHTVGKAFTYVFGLKMKPQSDAIITINNWFDVMNSRRIMDKNCLSCGLGIHLGDQMEALDKMEKLIATMKVNGKMAMMQWQKGILISIQSTRALYNDLVRNGPLDFILTSRLNQDCLENFFSRLRGIGGDNHHPTPVECLRRIRTMMVGKHPEFLAKNPAVQMEDRDSSFLSSEVSGSIKDKSHEALDLEELEMTDF